MPRALRLGCLVAALAIGVVAPQASRADVETASLVARDLTGEMTEARVGELTAAADRALRTILEFWSADARVDRLGKIRLEFDRPRKDTYGAVFLMADREGRRVRVVRVFGVGDAPQMVYHKLTHAVFPTPDKLIRNTMGIPMEARFGNPLTFPMCGARAGDWVLALRRSGAYIPLANLGPEHEDWGMSTRDGLPIVVDKARQHAAYAESGAFGEFLLETQGVEYVKTFYRLSAESPRPWERAFGASLQDLEARWLQALEAGAGERTSAVSRLVGLLKRDPAGACAAAQGVAPRNAPPRRPGRR